MTKAPLLLLIGLRGVGKTTLGRLLASSLGSPFLDGDEVVLAHLGAPSVHEAFARHGEVGFRAAELAVLPSLLDRSRGVVALGGGTPCVPGAETLLGLARRRGAVVIWLDADDETLAARIEAGSDRPPLTSRPLREEIAWLRGERQRTYRRLADARLDTAVFSPEGAVRTIRDWLSDLAGEITPPA